MPSYELNQAFLGVYNSSKEILKNKQRHLYCNMLDLLGRTCKTTGLAEKLIGMENLTEFWLNDILPMLFSEDLAVQTSAVSTFEQGLSVLDISAVHKTPNWSEIKSKLVTEYPEKIQKLREEKNSNWHQVWCFIIRVLDREILKGASTINSFLAVVEMGFRSADNQIRSEAFLCWRQLIKIFSDYKELTMPKRLKLICIPLRSSQSKTPQSATVKLRVWWYFLTCLGPDMTTHFENAVEPFLTFLFGCAAKSMTGVAQQFEETQGMALPCLGSLLLKTRDEYIERIMREYKLEILCVPSPLILPGVLERHWQSIMDACLAAIRLLNCDVNVSNYDHDRRLTRLLVTRTLNMVQELDLAECSEYFLKKLLDFLPDYKSPLNMVMNVIATEGFQLTKSLSNLENYQRTVKAIFSLFVATKSIVPPSILSRSLDQLKATCSQFENSTKQWQAYETVMRLVLDDSTTTQGSATEHTEVSLMLWLKTSEGILQSSQEVSLNYRLREHASLLDIWIMWPLENLVKQRLATISNNKFFNLFQQLLLLGQNSPDRLKYLCSVNDSLREYFHKSPDKDIFCKILDAYMESVYQFMKSDSQNCTNLLEQTLMIFKDSLEAQPLSKINFEQYLKLLLNLWNAFKPSSLNADIVQHILPILKLVARISIRDNYQQKKFFEEWKRNFLERVKGSQQKNLAAQIREALRGDDVFVIIPNVWSLNPDKLTERQKERFSEKADIPALYNDMSQSQDSSIKPWTPKKVVIAKKNQAEIVIGTSEKEKGQKNKDTPPENSTEHESPDILTQNAQRQSPSEVSSSSENGEQQRKLRSGKSATGTGATTQSETEKEVSAPSNSNANVTEEVIPRRTRHSLRGKLFDDLKESNTQSVENKETNGNDSKSQTKNKQSSVKRTLRSRSVSSDNQLTEVVQQPSVETQVTITEVVDLVSETPDCIISPQIVPEIEDNNTMKNGKATDEVIDVDAMLLSVSATSADISEVQTQVNESIQAKETSPKKTNATKIGGLLSSPPDRKSTNNSSSPSLRPKPVALTGRGAQLINMIRNKRPKLENTSSPSGSIFSRREMTPISVDAIENIQNNTCGNINNLSCIIGQQNSPMTSTPSRAPPELLTFSKRLPSPSASPSASILKRKLRRDSVEEISMETPVSKRKRVSFHDPPVSLTKEYERDCDEAKTKHPKRCLALDKVTLSLSDSRHSLKRRSRIDSLHEIEKFNVIEQPMEKSSSSIFVEPIRPLSLPKDQLTCDAEKTPISFYGHQAEQQSSALPPPTVLVTEETPAHEELSIDKAIEMVTQQCTIDEILGHWLNSNSTTSSSSSSSSVLKPTACTLAKSISKLMETDKKVKTKILETLSENHSKDFLDYAVQENLPTVVCERLNLKSVIDYVCAKAHLNANCRRDLLSFIPEILKHSKSTDDERIQFIKSIMQSVDLNNENILDLIKILLDIRAERETLTAGSGTRQDSESTSDVSSSNL